MLEIACGIGHFKRVLAIFGKAKKYAICINIK
jgi:hypothetical protein